MGNAVAVHLGTDKHRFFHWHDLRFTNFAATAFGVFQHEVGFFQVIPNLTIVGLDILRAANAVITRRIIGRATVPITNDPDIIRYRAIHSLVPQIPHTVDIRTEKSHLQRPAREISRPKETMQI